MTKIPIRFTILVLVLSLSAFIFSGAAFAFSGTVNGGTITDTENGVRIDGAGNIEFIGDFSTATGFRVDIYALNALLRDSTGFATIANGIYTLYGPGTLGMINNAGFIFGPAAQVNAANIIVSTLNISSADFFEGCRTGKFTFIGQGSYIHNQGKLIPQPGGYVCLLSQAIVNKGTIAADYSRIVLASGEKIRLSLDDNGTIKVDIDASAASEIFGPDGNKMNSAIENTGTIKADGGKVLLTAKSLNKVFDYAINNSGVIEAKSLNEVSGEIVLSAEGAPIINTGTIEANNININALNTDFLNYGDVIAGNIVINAINMVQDGLISADRVVEINVDNLVTARELVVDTDSVTGGADSADLPVAVIRGQEVRIKAKRIGDSSRPIRIDAALTYIYKTAGDIDISDSLGIGTSILLRGPPEGDFAIIYFKDSDLTLNAENGSIRISSDTEISAQNLTLISKTGIYSTGSLLVSNLLQLLSEGHISILGTINTNLLYERGASCELGGTVIVVFADFENADGAIAMNTGSYSGTFQDNGSIDVSNNAVITLIGNLIIWADGDQSGNGHFSMGNGSSIAGGGFDLTVRASDNSTLRAINNVGTLTIEESKAGTDPAFTLNNDITLTGGLTVSSGTLDPNGHVITGSGIANALSVTGTIIVDAATFAGNYSGFETRTLNAGSTVNYSRNGAQTIDSALIYSNLTTSGNNTKTLDGDTIVNGNLTIGGGTTLDVDNTNNYGLTVGGDWVNNGTFQARAGKVIFNGNGTQTLKSGGTSAAKSFNDIVYSGTGTLQLINNDLTINGDLTVSSGTFDPNGHTVTGNGGANALSVTGTILVDAATFAGNYTGFESRTLNAGSTVNYNSNNNQTIDATLVYYNLTTSGTTTTKKLGGATTVNGDLTIGSSTTLDVDNANNYGLTVRGNWVNSGTFQARAGKVIFNGSTAQTLDSGGTGAGKAFYSIVYSGTGTLQLVTNDVTVNGDLTILSGTFDPNSRVVTGNGAANTLSVTGTILVDAATFAGNYANFETMIFNAGSNVDYTGAVQTVDSSIPYVNLIISGGNAALGGDITITGNLTIDLGSDLSGAFILIVNGNAVFNGTLGQAGAPLTKLEVYGTSDINGVVVDTTGGTQLYHGVVTVCGMVNLIGSVTFDSNLISDPGDLTITGDAVFNLPVSGLNSLHVTGTTAINGGSVSTTLTQTYDGAVTLGANTILTGSTITFGSSLTGASYNLTLSADGTGDIRFDGAFILATLQITTADDVDFNADVNTTGGITQLAGTGTTTISGGFVDAGGDIDIKTGAITFKGNGRIRANNGAGSVTLNAQTGAITGGTAAADIVADILTFSSATGVGSALNPLSLDVNGIVSGTSAASDIYLDNTSGATYKDITAPAGMINITANASSIYENIVASGDITIDQAAGDMTIQGLGIKSTAGGIDITVAGGSISAIGAGPHLTAAADSSIHLSGGTITVTGTPLDVDITGILTLDMPNAGSVNGTCAILTGSVTGVGGPVITRPGWPLLINVSPNHLFGVTPLAPDGFVYFNGTAIWPQMPAGGFSDYILLVEELSRGRENAIYEIMKNFVSISPINPRTPYFYLYHPLTPVDAAAFDSINLDQGAYDFIADNLELKKRLSPYYGA